MMKSTIKCLLVAVLLMVNFSAHDAKDYAQENIWGICSYPPKLTLNLVKWCILRLGEVKKWKEIVAKNPERLNEETLSRVKKSYYYYLGCGSQKFCRY